MADAHFAAGLPHRRRKANEEKRHRTEGFVVYCDGTQAIIAASVGKDDTETRITGPSAS
jgi:hypothetical protein